MHAALRTWLGIRAYDEMLGAMAFPLCTVGGGWAPRKWGRSSTTQETSLRSILQVAVYDTAQHVYLEGTCHRHSALCHILINPIHPTRQRPTGTHPVPTLSPLSTPHLLPPAFEERCASPITGVRHGHSLIDSHVIDFVHHVTSLRQDYGETYLMVRLNEKKKTPLNGNSYTKTAYTKRRDDAQEVLSREDTQVHPRVPRLLAEPHLHGLRSLPLPTGVLPSQWRKAGPPVISRAVRRSYNAGVAAGEEDLFSRRVVSVATNVDDDSVDSLLALMTSPGRGVLLVVVYPSAAVLAASESSGLADPRHYDTITWPHVPGSFVNYLTPVCVDDQRLVRAGLSDLAEAAAGLATMFQQAVHRVKPQPSHPTIHPPTTHKPPTPTHTDPRPPTTTNASPTLHPRFAHAHPHINHTHSHPLLQDAFNNIGGLRRSVMRDTGGLVGGTAIGVAANPKPLEPKIAGDGDCAVTALVVDFVRQLLYAATRADVGTANACKKTVRDAARALLAMSDGRICLRHRRSRPTSGDTMVASSKTGGAALFGSGWLCVITDGFFELPFSIPSGYSDPLFHRAVASLVHDQELGDSSLESLQDKFFSPKMHYWDVLRAESIGQMEGFVARAMTEGGAVMTEGEDPAVPFAAVAFLLSVEHWGQRVMSVVSSLLCKAINLPHEALVLSRWSVTGPPIWTEPLFPSASEHVMDSGASITSYLMLLKEGDDVGHYEVLRLGFEGSELFRAEWELCYTSLNMPPDTLSSSDPVPASTPEDTTKNRPLGGGATGNTPPCHQPAHTIPRTAHVPPASSPQQPTSSLP